MISNARTMTGTLTLAAFVLAGLLLAGCNGDDSPTDPLTGTVEIDVLDESFSPSQVTIEAGTTVRWINAGNVDHTVTPDGHSEWVRALLRNEGEVFEHTFDDEGVFPYFCEPHQALGMTGTIRVEP